VPCVHASRSPAGAGVVAREIDRTERGLLILRTDQTLELVDDGGAIRARLAADPGTHIESILAAEPGWLARVDLETGGLAERRCGWSFGLSDQPFDPGRGGPSLCDVAR
jgi:hypothetical protein